MFRAAIRAVRPHVGVPCSAIAIAAAAGVLGIGPIGCAGHHHLNEAPPHPVEVEIDNDLAVPTEMTIYVVEDQGGARHQLGSVAGARNKTFVFTPESFGRSYQLVGVPQLARARRSPPFSITNDEVGTIVWSIQSNMVSFYNVADTTTGRPAPAPPNH